MDQKVFKKHFDGKPFISTEDLAVFEGKELERVKAAFECVSKLEELVEDCEKKLNFQTIFGLFTFELFRFALTTAPNADAVKDEILDIFRGALEVEQLSEEGVECD